MDNFTIFELGRLHAMLCDYRIAYRGWMTSTQEQESFEMIQKVKEEIELRKAGLHNEPAIVE